jgi:hypothetical protein
MKVYSGRVCVQSRLGDRGRFLSRFAWFGCGIEYGEMLRCSYTGEIFCPR